MSEFRALLDGYRRFRQSGWAADRARWVELASGQAPPAMLIGCSDSRVEPTRIFDTAPGQIFTVRNVANLVPPYEPDGRRHGVSAAIEFAVLELGVAHIVVLGHARCGGVAASLARRDLGAAGGSFIDRWVSLIAEARDRVVAQAAQDPALDPQRALEYAAIGVSLANLRSFPYVAEREADGRLQLHGAHFGIGDGMLRVLEGEEFVAVETAAG